MQINGSQVGNEFVGNHFSSANLFLYPVTRFMLGILFTHGDQDRAQRE